MIKIYTLIDNNEIKKQINNFLNDENYCLSENSGNSSDIIVQISNFMPDIILTDPYSKDCEYIIRQLKSSSIIYNTQIVFLIENDNNIEFLNLADGLITLPLKENVVKNVLNSHFKIKQSLDRLSENNKELSRSLYQLNVLYNTSSQFTGTLDADKLYDIMLEAMDKTLSFDISSLIIVNPLLNPVIRLNTIHKPSENLINAFKIRSILNYKAYLEELSSTFAFDDNSIEVVQKVKQERSNKMLGLEVFNYDTLSAPIKVGNDFFAVIELYRKTPFSTEDVTCFQSIAHQVALPLRSAKLYQEISVANKKLEKLEKLKSEFVSIVSHELRTPLTPINNSLEIVLSNQAGEITPDTRNFVSMAKRNIQRLSGIIEDLLDLSRIQTGKLDFKYKSVDITPSLELLYKTFCQVAKEKNISISLDINTQIMPIYADIRRIEQILSNLVSNSLKFTPNDGKIEITVETVEDKDIDKDELISPYASVCGKYLKISVKDNGIGIKNEDIPKIFDKFSQIESSLKRNNGGVGLGLTITKQLVDFHLGFIYVESKEKIGSKFSVLLPFEDDYKKFIMDLSHYLVTNSDVGIIKIKSDNLQKLVDELKENKLLNLTTLSKEVAKNGEYFVCLPKVSNSSFEAITRSISEYVNKYSAENNCVTMLKSCHSSNYANDLSKIITALNS